MELRRDCNGYVIDGVAYPRVSSVLEVLRKPGLERWRESVGLDRAREISAEAAAYGTEVHAACERVARGEAAETVAAAYRAESRLNIASSVLAFAEFLRQHVRRVLAVERVCYSAQERYAGTADLVYEQRNGRLAVGDLKTARNLSETYRVQLRAYQLALAETSQYRCQDRVVIWIPSSHPELFAVRAYTAHEQDARVWRALLTLYHWQREVEQDWRAEKKLLADIERGHRFVAQEEAARGQ